MNHLIIGLPNLPIQYMFYGVMNGKHIRYISSSNWNCTSKTIKHDHSLKKKAIDWLVVWNINFISPYIWNFIIPTDFHSMIFQRGRAQPPTSIDNWWNPYLWRPVWLWPQHFGLGIPISPGLPHDISEPARWLPHFGSMRSFELFA